MSNTHLFFNTGIGVKKPNSIRNKEQKCPFCDREKLTNILAVEDSIILLKNKYPVLENAYQTVLIETDDCDAELSSYSEEHLVKLMTFGLEQWQEIEKTGDFESVIFFKNHGPFSGGSIAHPHMQIVGLHDINYKEKVIDRDFEGLVIDEKDGAVFSLSTSPRIGFYELNVKLGDMNHVAAFAKYVQLAAYYILNDFPFNCNSYNLFFYKQGEEIYTKIVPRYVTTPIYIGYAIPQVPNNIEWMRDDIINRYFSKRNK
ncbi:DUF4931 domain-containing protein [Cytobacillus purgationiresistens]|uniref:ATP adenylyltransferase/5',5'''-P-1,P-4-tetraphosphate phosphorylase II n=1 Tax=Cytobacillus purgationiresistens TaxID=863449 RepID=A0ABU0ANZ7_9BACI|nr:DUF4931 domain-containing protein [Cytobacillus purgationiresistens]MDQ0273013.1 ATP adenylyltransferase/5',5'''-P-1,P-4-tetraphosphate phosphorylase II [Cytobacillus purgationiresistens]